MEHDMTNEQRAAIRRVLENPQFELIPMKNALDQAAFLPEGAMVSVTASPVKPLEETFDLAAELQRRGFDVIPHVSARMTRDHAHLEKIVARLHELGIRKLFVIGGDAEEPGEFFDAASILRALDDMGAEFDRIGIASYPEGHHVFDDETARLALHDKQPYASYMATQMCFDTEAIATWIRSMRADGITLPVVIGVPGVADRLKLMRISARIGVGRSLKFLTRHRGLLRSFVEPGGFSPDELLESLANTLHDAEANIINLHIYTFNQVETTERWRREYLASL
jgi:methylenetetrahydrofolate reductase (NADPH)